MAAVNVGQESTHISRWHELLWRICNTPPRTWNAEHNAAGERDQNNKLPAIAADENGTQITKRERERLYSVAYSHCLFNKVVFCLTITQMLMFHKKTEQHYSDGLWQILVKDIFSIKMRSLSAFKISFCCVLFCFEHTPASAWNLFRLKCNLGVKPKYLQV